MWQTAVLKGVVPRLNSPGRTVRTVAVVVVIVRGKRVAVVPATPEAIASCAVVPGG